MANTTRPASKLGSGCLVLFALPFAAVGVGMGVWLACTLVACLCARTWVETPARIVRTDLKEHPDNESTTYEVAAEYVYEYGGRKYKGDRVGLYGGSDNIGSFQQDAYRELSACQKSERPFRCYVNPDQPDQAVLYRDVRWAMLAFQMVFVLSFGGAGLGLLIGGFIAHRKQRAEAALAAAHPESPWMWKADWAAGRIVSSSKATMLAALAMAFFWNAISSPLWFVLPGEIIDKGNRMALLGLFFPAVGLTFVGWATLCILRWRKFGQSVLRMASVPGVIGGRLAGVIQTSAKVRPEDGFHLLLRCVRRVTTGGGEHRSTSDTILWEDERIVMRELLEDQAELSAIPVEFPIPYDCRPSDERNPDDQTLWRLTTMAAVPGMDYAATFTVPVFKTADSDPKFVPDRGATDERVAAPTPERELREAGVRKTTSPDGEGVRFIFPMARNPGMAVVFTVNCLLFGGVAGVAWKAGAPLFFPIIFGLIAAVMLCLLPNMWFYRSVVDISPRELAVSGGLFGLGATRRIAAADVKTMTTRQAFFCGQTTYFSLVVVCNDGKRITLGKRLPGTRLAEAVVRQMEQALGRREAPAAAGPS